MGKSNILFVSYLIFLMSLNLQASSESSCSRETLMILGGTWSNSRMFSQHLNRLLYSSNTSDLEQLVKIAQVSDLDKVYESIKSNKGASTVDQLKAIYFKLAIVKYLSASNEEEAYKALKDQLLKLIDQSTRPEQSLTKSFSSWTSLLSDAQTFLLSLKNHQVHDKFKTFRTWKTSSEKVKEKIVSEVKKAQAFKKNSDVKGGVVHAAQVRFETESAVFVAGLAREQKIFLEDVTLSKVDHENMVNLVFERKYRILARFILRNPDDVHSISDADLDELRSYLLKLKVFDVHDLINNPKRYPLLTLFTNRLLELKQQLMVNLKRRLEIARRGYRQINDEDDLIQTLFTIVKKPTKDLLEAHAKAQTEELVKVLQLNETIDLLLKLTKKSESPAVKAEPMFLGSSFQRAPKLKVQITEGDWLRYANEEISKIDMIIAQAINEFLGDKNPNWESLKNTQSSMIDLLQAIVKDTTSEDSEPLSSTIMGKNSEIIMKMVKIMLRFGDGHGAYEVLMQNKHLTNLEEDDVLSIIQNDLQKMSSSSTGNAYVDKVKINYAQGVKDFQKNIQNAKKNKRTNL